MYKKNIFQWLIAAFVSYCIMNCLIIFYCYDPGWIKREEGATRAIYEPQKMIIKAEEGYSVSKVDKNGYINQSAELSENGYVLILGNSQSNGNNVMPDKKYVSILNEKLQENRQDSTVKAYNMSEDGYDYCDIVQGFDAAIQEFPNSNAVIIQLLYSDFNLDKLKTVREQRRFTEESRGTYLIENLDFKRKTKNFIKDYFPLLIYLKEVKCAQIKFDFGNAFWHGSADKSVEKELAIEMKEYEEALEDSMHLLREEYDKTIVILNLHNFQISKDGTMIPNEEIYGEVLQQMCEKYGIIYCDMTDIYQKEYEKDYKLPFGFSNTKPGYGHLNEAGHQMVADELYKILKESRAEE